MGIDFEVEEAEGDWAKIPDQTWLLAKIIEIKTRTNTRKSDGEEFKKAVWKFEIQDEDDDLDERPISGDTGVKMKAHPDCRLWAWCSAAKGRPLAIEEKFNTDSILGDFVRILVKLEEYPDKDVKEKTRWVNKVVDVKPTTSKADAFNDAMAELFPADGASTPRRRRGSSSSDEPSYDEEPF